MNRNRLAVLLIVIAIGCGRPRVDRVAEISVGKSVLLASDETSGLRTGSEDWPNWRGPNTDGIATGAPIPTKWSATENVTWKVQIPGRGHSSPIIVGERIYIETADEKSETQSIACLDRNDGKQIWQTTQHQGQFERAMHRENTQASSTLASDGNRLYGLFLNKGHVVASALDMDGHEIWKKEIGSFSSKFGYSASPTLYKSLLLVAADHQQGGFIAALNCQNGEIVWRKPRPAKSSYASPRVISLDGRDLMILGGCNRLCGYDPLTGDELWQANGTAEAGVGTAVEDGGLIFASGGYPEQNTLAVDGAGKIVWEKRVKSYVPSMLAFEGSLYLVPDDGVFLCYDARSGAEKWKKRIGGNFRTSPILSGGHIFTTDMSGKTTVFKAGSSECEVVAENQLGTECFSSPAVSSGQLFLRVADSSNGSRQEWIYCIGKRVAAGG